MNKADNIGKTPPHITSEKADFDIVKILIANDGNFLDMNEDGMIPLDVG